MPPHSLHQPAPLVAFIGALFAVHRRVGKAAIASRQRSYFRADGGIGVCRLALWLPRASQWSVRRMFASQSSVGMQMTIGRNAACCPCLVLSTARESFRGRARGRRGRLQEQERPERGGQMFGEWRKQQSEKRGRTERPSFLSPFSLSLSGRDLPLPARAASRGRERERERSRVPRRGSSCRCCSCSTWRRKEEEQRKRKKTKRRVSTESRRRGAPLSFSLALFFFFFRRRERERERRAKPFFVSSSSFIREPCSPRQTPPEEDRQIPMTTTH